jgi:hypothetical protein
MPLANVTSSGINLQEAVNLLIAACKEMKCKKLPWVFVKENGDKLKFSSVNDIILDRLEALKCKDSELNKLGLESLEEDQKCMH